VRHQKILAQTFNLGVESLAQMTAKIAHEIRLILSTDPSSGTPGETWESIRYGQLQADTCEYLSGVCEKVLARISQIQRILKPILSIKNLNTLLSRLLSELATWVLDGILAQPGAIVDRSTIITKIAIPVSHAISSIKNEPSPSFLNTKLELAARIGSMSLIQVSNAFRREEFHGKISSQELSCLVNALQPDSSMKRAFMDEIAADL
jgi:hypothetical protein